MYETRAALVEDAETIAGFNQAMAMETEGKALGLVTLNKGVRRVFDEPSTGRYLVATDGVGGEVVGCLLITFEWSDWRNAPIWWIQSVYVHPDHRRRGVFKLLYRAVRERGEAAGVCGYRLYVERDNAQAQRTYSMLGMTRTPYLVYEDMSG